MFDTINYYATSGLDAAQAKLRLPPEPLACGDVVSECVCVHSWRQVRHDQPLMRRVAKKGSR